MFHCIVCITEPFVVGLLLSDGGPISMRGVLYFISKVDYHFSHYLQFTGYPPKLTTLTLPAQ